MGATGVEPVTFGFGVHWNKISNQDVSSKNGPDSVHAKIQEKVHAAGPQLAIAKSILTLASAQQQIPVELLQMLANNVLAEVRIQLARAILEGGDHALDRAIELAELLTQKSERTTMTLQGGGHVAQIAS